jgi:hypothetical protein
MAIDAKEAAVSGEQTKPSLNRYFVVSNSDGGWWIMKEGHRERLQRVRSKVAAIETSKLIARHHPPAEVHVEKQNGAIELCYSYNGPVIE